MIVRVFRWLGQGPGLNLRLSLGLSLGLTCLCMPAAHASPIELSLHAAPRVNAPVFTLADIVAVAGDDRLLVEELAAMPLQRWGDSQVPLRVDRAQVQRLAEWRYPQLRGRIRWQGVQSTHLQGAAETEPLAEAWRLARATLQAAHGEAALGAAVNSLTPRIVPAGGVQWDVRPVLTSDTHLHCASAEMRFEGARFNALSLCFARAAHAVPVARPRAAVPAETVPSINPPSGGLLATSARPMRPNEPAVRAGDVVQVRVAMGAARVETIGTAMSSGALGAPVRVRNSRSGGTFPAIVVDRGIVETGER
jgi:hypothetical protein